MSSVLSTHEKSLEALGNLLKTKREISGLTRRDVVVKTKIPLDQLESIEDGRLSSLPPVFAKGFLRAYANELGLDAEAILEDYRQMTGGYKNEPASSEPLAQKYVESSVGSGGWKPGPRFLVFLILVAAAVAASFWLWPGLRASAVSVMPFLANLPGFAAPAEPAGGPADSEPTTGPFALDLPGGYDDDPFPAETAAADNQESTNYPVSDPSVVHTISGSLSSPPESAPAVAPSPSGQDTIPLPPAMPGGLLVLTSQKDRVWLQVIIDGSQPQFYILNSGQKLTCQADDHIIVTAGQAGSVMVNWNGEDLGPLGETPVVERRFPRS